MASASNARWRNGPHKQLAQRRSPNGGAGDRLCLTATPVFAVMALLNAFGAGHYNMLCAAMGEASPFGGMVSMYLLMSAFHSAPRLKLISGR